MSDFVPLTQWGRVTHICVSKLTIIGSDNGLSPDRRQAIIWTNAGVLWIGPLGTNFSEISIEILTFSFKKMRLKVSSAKRRPFCLGLNVLIWQWSGVHVTQFTNLGTEAHPTRNLWAYNSNLVSILLDLILIQSVLIWYDQSTSSHMPRQLSCHGMCKIVTWSEYHFFI